jgi:hypothetical protein
LVFPTLAARYRRAPLCICNLSFFFPSPRRRRRCRRCRHRRRSLYFTCCTPSSHFISPHPILICRLRRPPWITTIGHSWPGITPLTCSWPTNNQDPPTCAYTVARRSILSVRLNGLATASTRQFRISETTTDSMSTQQHRLSASHTASIVHENADSFRVQQPASAIAQTAAEPPPAPIPRSTKGYCRHCRNHLGDFYNSWCRVTGSYFVPALLGSYSFSLKNTGKPKPASKGTDLEGW